MVVLILLGAPGAGKGTQAESISTRYGIPRISTGDIFRANVKEKTELGGKARGYMDSGRLVPDELVLQMVKGRIEADDAASGFILDGFPRNTAQAVALETMLSEMGRAIDHVIGIEVGKGELVRRLEGRMTCRGCGAGFHTTLNRPAKEGLCDKCGGELYKRPDDKKEMIEARLKVYNTETFPLIEYYKKGGLYRAVNGVGPIDEINKSITDAIGA